jgi:hypothetical protein
MITTPTNLTIADYCQAMERNGIRVNREYQRSEKVWPSAARSFLIETILLGFPMPKLAHYQVTDLKTRKISKEIVDGQQRSMAILDFYQGKFKLSRTIETEELQGKSYSQLNPEYQQRFLDYSLSIDLFVGATLEQVREVFRRINSYTVPLNPEEKRHAVFQGKFKWFVHRLARKFDESFSRIGVFGEKQLVRMQDTKLIAEIVHALVYGIQTTKGEDLFMLYKEFNEEFADESRVERQLTAAFDQLISWTDLHNTAVMKPNQVYALVLALIHLRTPVATLNEAYSSAGQKSFDTGVVIPRLSTLAEVLETEVDSVPRKHRRFAQASAEKTNVKEPREIRFATYCAALDLRHA